MEQQLLSAFAQTLAPYPAEIHQAEVFLRNAAAQPGYGITVLKVVSTDLAPMEVRQAAAVNFKNYVKFNWMTRDASDQGTAVLISDAEKETIKAHIIDLMLSSPPRVRAQLSEALTIISHHDFPAKWTGLLPQLLKNLSTPDQVLLSGVLVTADAIFHRYRGQFMSDSLSAELEYSQQVVQPLLSVLQSLTDKLPRTSDNDLRMLLENVRAIASMFYSLNSPGLTEAFEDTLDAWMDTFHKYLVLETPPALKESDPDKEGVVEGVKAAICEALGLFMERNEEEFAKYLSTFVEVVWRQLVNAGQTGGEDRFVMAAIGFLTAVARSVHYNLFGDPGALQQVCEGIIIPNVRIREDLEELFTMNWVEYVRRDTEGSDSDTRRRAASELVKALTDRYPEQVTGLFSSYVTNLLKDYESSPIKNWKSKDCALYLVTALAVKGKTATEGATRTNTLVDLGEFFSKNVAPELGLGSFQKGQPVLQADSLKFVTTFRSKLPKEALLALFPGFIEALGSSANVVHSYAAICIERLLTLKENGSYVFAADSMAPFLSPLLHGLFLAFSLPESEENEYVMRCVMRLITFMDKAIAPVALACIQALSQKLLAVCKNPRQPGFNHYLFESVAALVKHGCSADSMALGQYEEMLFPPFQVILQEDVQEFHPYIFQIFAQLIECRSKDVKLPEVYFTVLPPLLMPLFWERPGNVPALVRLLEAYLAVAAPEIVSRGHLQAVLGVFQKLIASKLHDHEGFYIIDALIEHLDLAALSEYLPHIWTLLFQRLQTARTTKFVKSFLLFVGLFIITQGAQATLASIEAVQQGLSAVLLEQVWIPNFQSVQGLLEEKVMVIAGAKVLADATLPSSLWIQLLEAIVIKLEGICEPVTHEGQDGGQEEEFSGYSAAYARLHNAARVERDPLAGVTDVKLQLVEILAAAGNNAPGRIPTMMQHAPPSVQEKLTTYCNVRGISLA